MGRLFEHQHHEHRPQNVNQRHQEEQAAGGFNTRLAVLLVQMVGSMPAAYTFAALAFMGLLAILGIIPPLVALLVAWTSQTLIQLTMLPVIVVGQNIEARHAELEADETYANTQRLLHELAQLEHHQQAQDAHAIGLQQDLDQLSHTQEQALAQIATSLAQTQELLGFLLDHFGVEARFDTAGHLPIVRLDQHRVSIDKDKLIAGLILAGHKAETVAMLDLPDLLRLDEKRPRHHEEADHAPTERAD